MLELRFPSPGRPLSINDNNARNWAAKRRVLEPWREGVGWAWNIVGSVARAAVKGKPCDVYVDIPFDVSEKQFSGTRRDPHNYVGTVVKALVDQLCAQGAWPDDTPEWVRTHEPNLVRGSEVVVRLVPQEAA